MALVANAATPDTANIPRGEITESGICVPRGEAEHYSQPQSTAGYATTNDALLIVEKTDDVPMRKNIGFGFRWKASGLPEQVVITYRIEHPQIRRPDGKSLTSFEESMTKETQQGKLETIDCYMLSEDHELVPGTWTLSVLYKGVVLVKRSFYIKQPQ